MAQDVRIKEGTLYLSSKEPKEGWDKQTFKNPQNKDETLTRYHKEISIQGKVEKVELKDDNYKGKVLSVMFSDKEYGELYLNLPVYSTGGVKTTDEYFNSFVGVLENISKGQEVKVFINNKNKDKKDRLYRNIVTLTPDNKIIKSNFNFSDIPRWESKEEKDDFGDVKTVWDASPTNKFFIEVLMRVVKKFNEGAPATQAEAEKPKTATSEEAFEKPSSDKTFIKETDTSDLPF